LIRFSIDPMSVCKASSCAASTMTLARASIGKHSSRSSATIARSSLTAASPCAATMPSSARCAREALMIWVPLTYQRIARAVLHQLTLLFGRLERRNPRWS
jgi:hypothetical protein